MDIGNVSAITSYDAHDVLQLGEVMVETGQAFGEDTSLGQLYMVVGEAQREITKSWYGCRDASCPSWFIILVYLLDTRAGSRSSSRQARNTSSPCRCFATT